MTHPNLLTHDPLSALLRLK